MIAQVSVSWPESVFNTLDVFMYEFTYHWPTGLHNSSHYSVYIWIMGSTRPGNPLLNVRQGASQQLARNIQSAVCLKHHHTEC